MHERGGGGWPYKLFSMPISPLHHQVAAITAIDLIHPSSHQPASVSFEQEHAVAGQGGTRLPVLERSPVLIICHPAGQLLLEAASFHKATQLCRPELRPARPWTPCLTSC